MTKHQIVYARYGENITTELSPVKPYNEDTDRPLLDVVDRYCLSFDDNQLIEAHKYEVREIELPEWLSPEIYCNRSDHIKWNYILNRPEIWEKLGDKTLKIFSLEYDQINALVDLFKVKNFRSEFRQSLFNQVLSWINQDDPRFRSPLSDRQWSALMKYNHGRINTRGYY